MELGLLSWMSISFLEWSLAGTITVWENKTSFWPRCQEKEIKETLFSLSLSLSPTFLICFPVRVSESLVRKMAVTLQPDTWRRVAWCNRSEWDEVSSLSRWDRRTLVSLLLFTRDRDAFIQSRFLSFSVAVPIGGCRRKSGAEINTVHLRRTITWESVLQLLLRSDVFPVLVKLLSGSESSRFQLV